jgi:hypothetical protein
VSTTDRLAGTWKLVSASSTTAKGERNETPYGLDPVGVLTYSPDGRVSALISHGGRKRLPVAAGTADQAEAFNTFLAYAGRYTLTGDEVVHHVDVSSIQNYVGKDLVRSVKFQGDQITLVTPPTRLNGKTQIIELIWRRLPVGS